MTCTLALQAYLGRPTSMTSPSSNRSWQVNIQADPQYRMRVEDIGNLEVRNNKRDVVPLRTLIDVTQNISGPAIVNRYNLYPSAELNGAAARASVRGRLIDMMETIGRAGLPSTMADGVDGTDLPADSGLERHLHQVGVSAGRVVRLSGAVAQYESWSLPLSIILIVPMCLLAAVVGILLGQTRCEHLRADRIDRADRVGGQERHSDRRVRQAVGGYGQAAI